MKLYLAGPMTGIPNHNYPAFHDAAHRLRRRGHEVINPAETHAGSETEGGETVPDDYRQFLPTNMFSLAKCDGVALLPGWEASKGTLLEIHAALLLGMPCYSYDPTADESPFCITSNILAEAVFGLATAHALVKAKRSKAE